MCAHWRTNHFDCNMIRKVNFTFLRFFLKGTSTEVSLYMPRQQTLCVSNMNYHNLIMVSFSLFSGITIDLYMHVIRRERETDRERENDTIS